MTAHGCPWLQAYETDAIVALAGRAAERREYPVDAYEDVVGGKDDADTLHIRDAVYKIVCLTDGKSFPEDDADIGIDAPTLSKMRTVFARSQETAALVEQLWPAIERVAKVLERRDLDQGDLDRLIAGGSRCSGAGLSSSTTGNVAQPRL